MKETSHIRKLMEAIQLNEYLVREGEPLSAVLQLNLFTDAESRPSEYEEDFANNREWMVIEDKYYGIAFELEQMVEKAKGTLDDEDVREIHNVWYDGSDAYDSPKEAINSLPSIYNAQIKVVKELLEGTTESINEDWGSSDWYALLNGMDKYIDDNGGVRPETIRDAAEIQAEHYHEYIGYPTMEATTNRIIQAWMDMTERGRNIKKMFAPKESVNEADSMQYDLEVDGEDVIIHDVGGEPVLVMSKDNWVQLANKFIQIHRVK